MPTCRNCGREWSWKQTFKKMITLNTAMECPHCGEKQYYTKQARRRTALLTFLTPFIILLNFLDISPYILVGVYLVYCILIMGVFPFLIELSNEEEPLW
ncbi:TIGR04104 family putative zinc finger protein [Sediminibacillus massiliensis]|uniref:TIGR04104 family putative zinc finger protein n=1 Tax=Sediminibacillus massiliensis TaxID=1926277 RepID=UPI000988720E|nr:TIGR04104 family putative zinc finger protein [Sediminibacillus massiliensis]